MDALRATRERIEALKRQGIVDSPSADRKHFAAFHDEPVTERVTSFTATTPTAPTAKPKKLGDIQVRSETCM